MMGQYKRCSAAMPPNIRGCIKNTNFERDRGPSVVSCDHRQENYDHVRATNKTAQEFFNRNTDNETGWDRLYLMFSIDEFHRTSPELNSTIQAGFMGLFIGACYGGFIRSRVAYMNFMENNQATAFVNHMDAKKKLQDAVTVAFGRGALQWGWRLGLFTFSFVGVSTAMAVYRGKSGILEYTTAGAVTGTTYKWNLGPRGMLVGGLVGAVMGSVAGAVTYGIMKTTGISMEEVRYWQYQWKSERDNAIRQVYKQHRNQDEPELLMRHNQVVGEVDPTKALEQIERTPKVEDSP